ncbi:NT-3 growth factor receptor-like isoform X1 [Arapaima gigas]
MVHCTSRRADKARQMWRLWRRTEAGGAVVHRLSECLLLGLVSVCKKVLYCFTKGRRERKSSAVTRRLDEVVFDCDCNIRWIQLWQQRGEAGLQNQLLYCNDGVANIPLHLMNISQCDLPEISVTHSNLTVTEGDNVTFTCNGSGAPLPEVDWIVGDLHSINTHQANVYWPNIHSLNLTLVNVSRDDNGFALTCIAENVVGMTNASIQLAVQFPPVIVKLDEPERRHDTCIEFTVRGYPHPTLRWIYNGKEIPQSEYIRTEMDVFQDYLEGCLMLKNPTHHNNGNYTLVAANFLGTAVRTVYGHFLPTPFPPGFGSRLPVLQVTIAVGLAGFACVLLVLLFVLVNKYGRRSKFGMKGRCILRPDGIPSAESACGLFVDAAGATVGAEFEPNHLAAKTSVCTRRNWMSRLLTDAVDGHILFVCLTLAEVCRCLCST